MKVLKKMAAVVAALTLTIGMVSSVSAASWTSYFGLNKGWYEGTKGSMSGISDSGWTANIQSLGWGGCWGGQAHKKGLGVKKGNTHNLKFTMKSSKLDKYVWVKLGDDAGKQIDFGKWLDLKKGKTVTVNETFTAKYDCDAIHFGFGGDCGDRESVKTDKDAKVRYKYAPNKTLDRRLGDDAFSDHPTTITLSGFSLTAAGSSGSSSNTGSVSNGSSVNGSGSYNSGSTVNTVNPSDTTVSTGDFTPIACGATAVLAAAVIVVFSKRRQED